MLRISVILLLVVFACATADLLGGFEDVDVNDEGVKEALDYAAQYISKRYSNKYHHKLVKVVKAKRQVVNGYNYKFDIILGMTHCKKEEVSFEEAKNCEIQDGVSAYKKCSVSLSRDLKGNYPSKGFGCTLISKNDI